MRAQKLPSNLSPQSKKTLKKVYSDIHKRAFNEIVFAKAAKGGDLYHGVIASVIKRYSDLGYSNQVRVQNIEYQMQLMQKGKVMKSEKDIQSKISNMNNKL